MISGPIYSRFLYSPNQKDYKIDPSSQELVFEIQPDSDVFFEAYSSNGSKIKGSEIVFSLANSQIQNINKIGLKNVQAGREKNFCKMEGGEEELRFQFTKNVRVQESQPLLFLLGPIKFSLSKSEDPCVHIMRDGINEDSFHIPLDFIFPPLSSKDISIKLLDNEIVVSSPERTVINELTLQIGIDSESWRDELDSGTAFEVSLPKEYQKGNPHLQLVQNANFFKELEIEDFATEHPALIRLKGNMGKYKVAQFVISSLMSYKKDVVDNLNLVCYLNNGEKTEKELHFNKIFIELVTPIKIEPIHLLKDTVKYSIKWRSKSEKCSARVAKIEEEIFPKKKTHEYTYETTVHQNTTLTLKAFGNKNHDKTYSEEIFLHSLPFQNLFSISLKNVEIIYNNKNDIRFDVISNKHPSMKLFEPISSMVVGLIKNYKEDRKRALPKLTCCGSKDSAGCSQVKISQFTLDKASAEITFINPDQFFDSPSHEFLIRDWFINSKLPHKSLIFNFPGRDLGEWRSPPLDMLNAVGSNL